MLVCSHSLGASKEHWDLLLWAPGIAVLLGSSPPPRGNFLITRQENQEVITQGEAMNKPKRSRKLLPAIPSGATLESSTNNLEDSRETIDIPSEKRSTVATEETTIKEELKVIIVHPTQTTFTCPLCSTSYHVYTSLQRHMRDRHKDRRVAWIYICRMQGGISG